MLRECSGLTSCLCVVLEECAETLHRVNVWGGLFRGLVPVPYAPSDEVCGLRAVPRRRIMSSRRVWVISLHGSVIEHE
jgi:hypothetical protein